MFFPSQSMAEMLMEFHITLQGDFWWCRKNVVPLHLLSRTLLTTKKLENYEERNLETDFSDCTHNLDGARHYPRSNIMHGGINYFSITLKQKELWQQKEH